MSGVVVTARRPTHLEGVTVTAVTCLEPDSARYPAAQPPAVIDSYPHPGAVVAPGRLLVRISFDAPMSCYSEVTTEGGVADPCEPSGNWEAPGRRSWIMQCRLEPDTTYKMHFRKAGGPGFIGLSGRPATPFDLAFTTSHAPPTLTEEAAARSDVGAPGEAPATAYLTCVDTRGAPTAHDCQRHGFRRRPE